jgi:pectate lyase
VCSSDLAGPQAGPVLSQGYAPNPNEKKSGKVIIVDAADAKASDEGAGTAAAPLKTIAKALALAQPGDEVVVRPGEYAEEVKVALKGTEEMPILIRAEKTGETILYKGLAVENSSFVRVRGFKLTWPKEGGPTDDKASFTRVAGSNHIELADLTVSDNNPDKDTWVGYGGGVNGSQFVTIRNCKFNYIYAFGVAFGASTDCLVDGCDIGPWNFEDGIRFHNCQRITIQNCDIHNSETYRLGSTKTRKGHIDLIQFVRENHYIVMRNNLLHGSGQGLTAFSDHEWEGKRKGIWVEGNVVYDCSNNKYKDRKSTRLNSSHNPASRMPSSA